jgi:hypothetical protein
MFVPTFKIRPAALALCALLLSYAAVWWLRPHASNGIAPESQTTQLQATNSSKAPRQCQSYATLFDELATNDLQSAVRLLDSVNDSEKKAPAIRAVAAAWAAQDVDAAIDWAKTLTPTERAIAIETILQPLSTEDPARALELAKEYLKGPPLLAVAAATLTRLASEDAVAAAETMTTLPREIFQTPAALEVTRALADESPDSVVNFVTNFPSIGERRTALNSVLDVWAISQPEDAARQVSSMPAGADQTEAAAHLAHCLASNDPDEAIEFAASLKSGAAHDAALLQIASGWAQHDPAAAAEWSLSIPSDCAVRADAINAIVSAWEVENSKAAEEWLKSLRPADQVIAMRKTSAKR